MSEAQKILELAEKYRDYTAENLGHLIRNKSLSCKEEWTQKELVRQMKDG